MKPLTPTTPHVIIMVGIPGAGKTTFADHFAKTFKAPIVSHQRIAEQTQVDEVQVVAVAEHLLDEIFKTRHTLIYEGPTHTKADRTAITKRITDAGYKPLLVWVQTESAEAMRRATKAQPGKKALSPSDFDAAIRSFVPPALKENPVVISGKHTYTTQIKVILKHLAGPERPAAPEPPRARPARNIILR